MSCQSCRQHLRSWLRGELSDADAEEVRQHVSQCYFCAAVVENESAILDSLHINYEVPSPSVDFKKRVLASATSTQQPDSRSLTLPIAGGAIAAALALGIALGVGFQSNDPVTNNAELAATQNSDAGVVLNSPHNVQLAFNSAKAIDNVTLTVELPPHVEMSSYPGYQRLSWKVSLDKGENIVKLPLNVLFPGDGELVAHLDDGQSRKTFRAPLTESDVGSVSEPVL